MTEARHLPTLKYAPAIPNMMALENTNTEDFDNAVKVKIIKETVETSQSAILRLFQERFQSFNNPNTYEAQIHLLLLGIANNNAQILGTFKTHLSADINEFFILLKNIWLECSSLYVDQNSDQAQSKKKLFTKQNNNVQSSQPASNILQFMVSQPAFPLYDEMQKLFQAIIDKQNTKYKAKMEKLKAEFESKMSQQLKKSHSPVLPKDHKQIHEFYADQRDPR
ncbi:759_t:CDS:2 [Cetraspora pellucida]|uniref:759_t:CDS:1 n=1 Tax=Cetraspora pellucida TaxID=1433469 RepID=A0A9N9FNL8_9GLOM|nr:759_t:CDS:2 [Cetraspora pellucida]